MAAVMDRLRSFRRNRYVSFDYLPDEQAVARNHASVAKTAFKIRIALRDQGRLHLLRPLWRKAKPLELVDICAVAIADADNRVDEIDGRKIDYAGF